MHTVGDKPGLYWDLVSVATYLVHTWQTATWQITVIFCLCTFT